MSEQPHGGHPPAEVDRVQGGKLVAVGVGALALFLVASLLSMAALRRERRELNPDYPVMPAEGGKQKIGIVEQQLFVDANGAQVQREQQREQLDSYGWVDRPRGLVHIPIERAMDLTARGARP